MITITNAAKEHFINQLKESDGAKFVRLSLKTTGCSGLSYVFDLVDGPSDGDIEVKISDDLVFYVDSKNQGFIKGLNIDYVKKNLGYELVYSNPNATGACGCGESFTTD